MDNFQMIDVRLRNIESLLLSQKTVLNFDEVADYTGLSKSYLYKLTCSGGIPCYKPQGKHIYFNKQEIDQWLMQNRKATNSELDSQAATFVTLKSGAK
ncbi:MAG: helix-turn-helix domain-containing protein [Saprospiraceae bacterium]|nr:helix-turn-helix domain-containing protein [Saprospiraceae bacterium]MBK6564608.1 helix-turn-helix domain-containing protein [Saprospiraceae bacterium]MBK6782792.1 helix-turn-helix domain-containing protein [Saprospiraceae bacterium]MBK7523249.1 helix-turn-helix domain-containing protein [Saprospiraceae bacterium]MBK8079342.1 helix-turn-helix domain-containing protein [Saprospiraceae bacterium]